MIGPGEHPADEPCGGLCGAPACMDKALAEMGITMSSNTYSSWANRPATASLVMADIDAMPEKMRPMQQELERITADLYGAITMRAAALGCSWDTAAVQAMARLPTEWHGDRCGAGGEARDEDIRQDERKGKRRRPTRDRSVIR